jgi:GNAT superfamily N-acetyltransferase
VVSDDFAVEIQRLTPQEPMRLRAIRLRALREAPYAFTATFGESAARPLEVWSQQLVELATFVAVSGGSDVGLVRAGPDASGDAALLLSMWVTPEVRGMGAGEALIDAVVAWARAQGFARLVLDVGDDNAHAIALYARKGFEPTSKVSASPQARVGEHRRVLKLS